jgi:hypothetical protein
MAVTLYGTGQEIFSLDANIDAEQRVFVARWAHYQYRFSDQRSSLSAEGNPAVVAAKVIRP